MKIEEITIGAAKAFPVQKNSNTSTPAISPNRTTETTTPRKTDNIPETQTKLSENRVLYSKIIGTNNQSQTLAQQIRKVDETMERVSENVQNMRNSLDSIIKVFPPYPKESSERIEALRQFSSFRKMIDQLTLPPPDDSPLKILGDDKKYPDAGDWELEMGQGTSGQTIRHQPIHTGEGGLEIPDLPTDAPDRDLHLAVKQLDNAHQTLALRHQYFVADANRVIKSMI